MEVLVFIVVFFNFLFINYYIVEIKLFIFLYFFWLIISECNIVVYYEV